MDVSYILYFNINEELSHKALNIIMHYDTNNEIILRDAIKIIRSGKKPRSLKRIPTLYVVRKTRDSSTSEKIENNNVIYYLLDMFQVNNKIQDSGYKNQQDDRKSRYLRDINKKYSKQNEKSRNNTSHNSINPRNSNTMSDYDRYIAECSGNHIERGENDIIGLVEKKTLLDSKLKRNKIVHRIAKKSTGETRIDMMQDRRYLGSREIGIGGRKGHSIEKVGLLGGNKNTPALELIKTGKDGKPIVINEKKQKRKVVYS